MLRKIGLTNFKCWRELDIELAPITLFFGTNSSGKTAILQSLLMLKQTARGFDPGQHINFGDDNDYVKLGSYQDLVYGHDENNNLGIMLDWKTTAKTFFATLDGKMQERSLESLRYEITWGKDKNIFIDKLNYRINSKEAPTERINIWRDEDGSHWLKSTFSGPTREPASISSPEKCYVLPWTARYGSENEEISILSLNGEFERLISKLQYIGPLRLRPERHYQWTGGKPEVIEPTGANTIQALIASTHEDRRLMSRASLLLREMELVDEFEIRPIDQNQRLYEAIATIASVQSSLADTGFGVSQILPVITMLLTAPMGSIVLLEQPELHLHPGAQSALADLMLLVADSRNLQLIVESHSEHLLRRLQRRIAEEHPHFANPENIRTYFCQSGAVGSKIEEVEIDRFGQIANWPARFLGDISGDVQEMSKATFRRLDQERVGG